MGFFILNNMNNINYNHVVELSKEEKVNMYMSLEKEKLIEMLINCNEIIDNLSNDNNTYIYNNNRCNCNGFTEVNQINGHFLCGTCGKRLS